MPDLDAIYPTMKTPEGLTKKDLRSLSREEILEARLEAFNTKAAASELPDSVKEQCKREIKKRVNTAPSLVELQRELPHIFETEADPVLGEAAARFDPAKEQLLEELYQETDFSSYAGKVGQLFSD